LDDEDWMPQRHLNNNHDECTLWYALSILTTTHGPHPFANPPPS